MTGWHRHFGPPSGYEPKIRDARGRYVLLAFTYGANLGPAQVARHMRKQVSVHKLHQATKYADANKIHKGSMDVINAYADLDLSRLYGDGTRAGMDGTQLDTWADNLMAESHIRYGGYGVWRIGTSPTPTSRCSPISSRAGCGRPSTFGP